MNDSLECKLCDSEGHTLGRCHTFNNYNDKVERFIKLSLCTSCVVSGQDENACYGKQYKFIFKCQSCRRREHTPAWCPQVTSMYPLRNNVHLCLAQRNIETCKILPAITLYLKSVHKSKWMCE